MAKSYRDISRYKRNVLVEYREIQALERELKMLLKKVDKVNKMLKALKKSGQYKESIAVENLVNFLDSSTVQIKPSGKSGLYSKSAIKTKVKMKNVTSLTAINKALDSFIQNKTSTPAGMDMLYKQRKDELLKYLDEDFVESLSYEDLKTIYSVYQSNEYDTLQNRMGSAAFFSLYTQAIDEEWDKNKFVNEVDKYIESGEDLDLKEAITKIYDNYISNW